MAKANGIQENKSCDGSVSSRAQVRIRGFPRGGRVFARRTDSRMLEAMRVTRRKVSAMLIRSYYPKAEDLCHPTTLNSLTEEEFE